MVPHDKGKTIPTNWALIMLSGNATILMRLHQAALIYKLQRNLDSIIGSSDEGLTVQSVSFSPNILVNATLNGSPEWKGYIKLRLQEVARENNTLVTLGGHGFQLIDIFLSNNIMAPNFNLPTLIWENYLAYIGIWTGFTVIVVICFLILCWYILKSKLIKNEIQKNTIVWHEPEAHVKRIVFSKPLTQSVFARQYQKPLTDGHKWSHRGRSSSPQHENPIPVNTFDSHEVAPLASFEDNNRAQRPTNAEQGHLVEDLLERQPHKYPKYKHLDFQRHSGGGYLPMHSVFKATSLDHSPLWVHHATSGYMAHESKAEVDNHLQNRLKRTQEDIDKEIEPVLRNLGLLVISKAE